MRIIFKYNISPSEEKQEIQLPEGAEIMHVQGQNGSVYLWAMVEDNVPKEPRIIEMFTTGQEIPLGMGIIRAYIGTFELLGGDFIGHVFERLN